MDVLPNLSEVIANGGTVSLVLFLLFKFVLNPIVKAVVKNIDSVGENSAKAVRTLETLHNSIKASENSLTTEIHSAKNEVIKAINEK